MKKVKLIRSCRFVADGSRRRLGDVFDVSDELYERYHTYLEDVGDDTSKKNEPPVDAGYAPDPAVLEDGGDDTSKKNEPPVDAGYAPDPAVLEELTEALEAKDHVQLGRILGKFGGAVPGKKAERMARAKEILG